MSSSRGAYFQVRRKRVSREAALCATGITEEGEREYLGFLQGPRESQQAWDLPTQLVRRGWDPQGVRMITSDGCPGIMAAIGTAFPYREHQRCLFHKMANLQVQCPKMEWPLIKARLDRITYAPHLLLATAQAGNVSQEYGGGIFPAWVECLEKDLEACLAYRNHPPSRWKHMRTTHVIERSFQEGKRRVKVMELSSPLRSPASVSSSPCFRRKTRTGKVVLSRALEITPLDGLATHFQFCYKFVIIQFA